MNAKEFVASWKREKDRMLQEYCERMESGVSVQIASLNVSDDQRVIMRGIVDSILTDVFYSLLLGLDGEANIGGHQETYRIYDEDGNLISECGEIEAEAYEQFHGK